MNAALLTLALALTPSADQELLWPKGAPGAKGTEDVDKPRLHLYPAPEDKATGAAVVVCPGGGYRNLAMDHEGKEIAEWLNKQGISAFVLQYRLGPRYNHPAPMQDVQRALRMVRSRAKDWKLDPARVGVWGFSAGGHLASTAATHFDDGDAKAEDPIDRVSCRPDFAILAYPVISMKDPYVHKGSRTNLLGDKPDEKLIELLSNDLQVTAKTPPTFLFHTGEDTGVPAENSILFYMALRKNKVAAEMHIYEKGAHGLGISRGGPVVTTWKERLADWLTLHTAKK